MAFASYTPEYGPKEGCWASRNGVGLVSLRYDEQANTLHIHFASSIDWQNVPQQYGEIFMHVSPDGIRADGYMARCDDKGHFAGKEPTDAAVLAEFKPCGLPGSVKDLFRKAVDFKGEIKVR